MSMHKICCLFIFFLSSAHAADVRVSVIEEQTNETTYYSFNPDSGKLNEAEPFHGVAVSSQGPFEIRNHRLILDDKELAEANSILFQGQFHDAWVLIVTSQYNSYSNPLRWLSAFSGHPIQVTRVEVLAVRNGLLISKKQLIKRPSSYHWQASVLTEKNELQQEKP